MSEKEFILTYQQVNVDFQDYASNVCGLVGGYFLSVPMKSWVSCSRKAKAENCKISNLKDIIRCSFIFETEKEVLYVVEKLQSLVHTVRVKNRMKNKGYRDVLINVSFEGIVCEIQLHTALGLAAKDGKAISHPVVDKYTAKLGSNAGLGHKLYELERVATSPQEASWYRGLGITYYSIVRAM
jgi:hypothetical protein